MCSHCGMTLWVLKCVSGYISVWVFPHFDPSCEFFPTELQQSGPVIHLFHSPYAIVIALVQCWFFIRYLFPMSPGWFSFIRPSLKRQCKASRCPVPPGKNSFYSEWVISRQNWDHWGDLRRNSAVLSLCLPLSFAYKYISKHPMPKARDRGYHLPSYTHTATKVDISQVNLRKLHMLMKSVRCGWMDLLF